MSLLLATLWEAAVKLPRSRMISPRCCLGKRQAVGAGDPKMVAARRAEEEFAAVGASSGEGSCEEELSPSPWGQKGIDSVCTGSLLLVGYSCVL